MGEFTLSSQRQYSCDQKLDEMIDSVFKFLDANKPLDEIIGELYLQVVSTPELLPGAEAMLAVAIVRMGKALHEGDWT